MKLHDSDINIRVFAFAFVSFGMRERKSATLYLIGGKMVIK